MAKCKNCGHTEIVVDLSNANNDRVCKACGVVSEDNPIVSEVTFGETSSGAAVVQGSFVAAGQAHAAFGPHGTSALESREATLNNARRKLQAVSHALQIPEYVREAAFQWYQLALSNNFVQGRRSQNVIAACLYVACRKEKTHHMLIDFSSRLQVSVYSIGATFLKMVKVLHIVKLPLADPSLFIQHFAEKLDLGDKKIKVVKDAVKLAQTMSKDWMYEGRRPAGIAGACLLLACRMNNLRRTHSEVVAVSHVAEETLQQRLNEFKNTKSGNLSIKQFRDTSTEEEVQQSDSKPPSFRRNRLKETKLKEKGPAEHLETSDQALARNPILSQVLGGQEVTSKEVLFYLKQISERRERALSKRRDQGNNDSPDAHSQAGDKRSRGDASGSDYEDQDGSRLDSDASSEHSQGQIDGYSLETDPYRPRNLHLLPTSESLLSKVSDDPENLEDVDDEELEAHILDEEASKLKERIWIGINGEYLLEQESKRLKLEADLASGNTSLKKKRSSKKRKTDASNLLPEALAAADPTGIQPALQVAEASGDLTTAESVKNMLQKTSFSKKINYDAIDGLFGG
ncbi:AEL213Wp [Eremothecium gossypii ATCC 10895]|uniref:Transcription factor IIIB 70 kDa subunit n=1 Tax=Eremothecium gossypii (strain ATCC 10895 / CBS 109.51 / FGSC 9923 / NRRL Y-1056) TaxID=284811 RepID=Q758H5_EREGS|nr:AEL213Wp [Eremothecium gossypii ATCC 10895]AAS52472.1 AEL213Wp [Eremothecium gossypii ATCC 10895]